LNVRACLTCHQDTYCETCHQAPAGRRR
jgi:hypothetical protein